jgi:uncharacterized membrane protein (UPF0127 family)
MSNAKKRARNRLHIVIAIVLVLALVASINAYFRFAKQEALLPVSFQSIDGKPSPVYYVEVARTDTERRKGLMYRKTLDENAGMLFIFPDEDIRSFYMKNTYIPLDMIFISKEKRVVGIIENVPILNSEPRTVSALTQYILELNAGQAKAANIQVGSAVSW